MNLFKAEKRNTGRVFEGERSSCLHVSSPLYKCPPQPTLALLTHSLAMCYCCVLKELKSVPSAYGGKLKSQKEDWKIATINMHSVCSFEGSARSGERGTHDKKASLRNIKKTAEGCLPLGLTVPNPSYIYTVVTWRIR